MTVRPIIFSGSMVQAIQADRKTQTRRLVRVPAGVRVTAVGFTCFTPPGKASVRGWTDIRGGTDEVLGEWFISNPFGKKDDRLWVREAWCPLDDDFVAMSRGQEPSAYPWEGQEVAYKADDPKKLAGYWRPSIHMPRWACRLYLGVESVHAERLQDITTEAIIAEGIEVPNVNYMVLEEPTVLEHERHCYAREKFRELWDGLNAKRAPWSSNPWIWCISFSVVRQRRELPEGFNNTLMEKDPATGLLHLDDHTLVDPKGLKWE